MARRFRTEESRSRYAVSVVLGMCAAFVLFLLVPLTQMFREAEREIRRIRQAEVASPRPPPPPPEPPPEREEREEERPPELEREPPRPTLEQLDLSLQPGTGGDPRMAVGSGIDFATESPEEMMRLFEFGELDRVPRIKRRGPVDYPPELRRRGVEGQVTLLVIIDRSGRVRVEEVLDYSHRAFVQPAVEGARTTRFTTPTRDGEPVRAKYSWTIEFEMR